MSWCPRPLCQSSGETFLVTSSSHSRSCFSPTPTSSSKGITPFSFTHFLEQSQPPRPAWHPLSLSSFPLSCTCQELEKAEKSLLPRGSWEGEKKRENLSYVTCWKRFTHNRMRRDFYTESTLRCCTREEEDGMGNMEKEQDKYLCHNPFSHIAQSLFSTVSPPHQTDHTHPPTSLLQNALWHRPPPSPSFVAII